MIEVSKTDIEHLVQKGIIKNTCRGFISLIRKDSDGRPAKVGYYKTVKGRHRFLEDEYALRANKLRKGRKCE